MKNSQIVIFYIIVYITGKDKQYHMSWDSWFGHNVELSRLVMEFISSPRNLYNVEMVNKITMQDVTTTMVVRCSMFGGSRQYRCIQLLQKLMMKRAIYPPSPLRLIRLVNGKRCKFCNNDANQNVRTMTGVYTTSSRLAIEQGPFKVTSDPKPRQIRGLLGLFACYPCMTEARPPVVSKNWSYPCLT